MAENETKPELIEHLGWDLWRAALAWKQRFAAEMAARGYPWLAGARGNLVPFIERDGTPQLALAQRAGMTKQAVQQLLDDLVKDGVVERVPDPTDARRKVVRFTAAGRQALDVANTVKRSIEADYEKLLGAATMVALQDALRRIGDDDD